MVYAKYGELAMLQCDMFMDIPFFFCPLPHKDGWNSFLSSTVCDKLFKV